MSNDCEHLWCYYVSFDSIWNYFVIRCYKCGKVHDGYPEIIKAFPKKQLLSYEEAETFIVEQGMTGHE